MLFTSSCVRKPLLLLTLLAFLAGARSQGAGALIAGARVPEVALDNTEARSIASRIEGRTYGVLVALPDGYAESTRSYPVLYVLDGWHFPLVEFIASEAVYSKKIPELIVVTLDHGAGKETRGRVMDLRRLDFTPTKVPGDEYSGGADKFLAFMEEELIPYVDATYRTDRRDRALLGHSYGGLFAIYALLHQPGLFVRIVAASPSLGWDGGSLIRAAPSLLMQGKFKARVDFSYGSDESGEEKLESVQPFFWMLETSKPVGLDYRFTIYPGENHSSVRPSSFSSGLAWVYAESLGSMGIPGLERK
jgi:predicted alpha/beta superfamily hydrolase